MLRFSEREAVPLLIADVIHSLHREVKQTRRQGIESIPESIYVKGDEEFTRTTARALTLLHNEAPTVYALVIDNLHEIHQKEGESIGFSRTGGIFVNSPTWEGEDPDWYASVLAYSAYKLYIYHKNPLEPDAYAGLKAEREALQYQKRTLIFLGKAENRDMINHVNNLIKQPTYILPRE